MARDYTYATTLRWEHPEDDSLDVEIEVETVYGVDPGYPARGPSYSSGGEPGEPASIDDVDIVKVDGKPWAQFAAALPFGLDPLTAHEVLTEKLVEENGDQMFEVAADRDEADYDDYRSREEREEDARYWADRQNGDDD